MQAAVVVQDEVVFAGRMLVMVEHEVVLLAGAVVHEEETRVVV